MFPPLSSTEAFSNKKIRRNQKLDKETLDNQRKQIFKEYWKTTISIKIEKNFNNKKKHSTILNRQILFSNYSNCMLWVISGLSQFCLP